MNVLNKIAASVGLAAMLNSCSMNRELNIVSSLTDSHVRTELYMLNYADSAFSNNTFPNFKMIDLDLDGRRDSIIFNSKDNYTIKTRYDDFNYSNGVLINIPHPKKYPHEERLAFNGNIFIGIKEYSVSFIENRKKRYDMMEVKNADSKWTFIDINKNGKIDNMFDKVITPDGSVLSIDAMSNPVQIVEDRRIILKDKKEFYDATNLYNSINLVIGR